MATTFFQEILQINRDINLEYRESKAPLFITNFRVNRRRNRLRKIINKINKNILPTELLKEYSLYIYNIMEAGDGNYYKHCAMVEPYDRESPTERLIISFKIDIKADVCILASFSDIDNTGKNYICTYTLYSNGNMNTRFSEENVSMLKSDPITEYPWNMYEVNDMVKSTVCKTIMEDIVTCLLDEVERSERINL